MPKLIIIGQSPAAFSAIRTMRTGGVDWDITLVSTDGELPYDRSFFPGMVTRKNKEKDVFCAGFDFYKNNKVEVILDKELSRINVKRRKLFLADRLQLDYDALLITDTPHIRLPEVKGSRRRGVFHFSRLDSIRQMLKHMIEVETVVVAPTSLRGIEMALAFKLAEKEVILVLSQEKILPGEGEVVEGALNEMLRSLIDGSGLRIMPHNNITDVLGEGEVQAVRLHSGKVLACGMLVVEDAAPDLRFLAEDDLLIQDRICVHTTMRSNRPDVYAADAVMELADPKFLGSYSMETALSLRQGEVAAKTILGVEEPWLLERMELIKRIESIFAIDIVSQLERGSDGK